jgi:hypothetical protein
MSVANLDKDAAVAATPDRTAFFAAAMTDLVIAVSPFARPSARPAPGVLASSI